MIQLLQLLNIGIDDNPLELSPTELSLVGVVTLLQVQKRDQQQTVEKLTRVCYSLSRELNAAEQDIRDLEEDIDYFQDLLDAEQEDHRWTKRRYRSLQDRISRLCERLDDEEEDDPEDDNFPYQEVSYATL